VDNFNNDNVAQWSLGRTMKNTNKQEIQSNLQKVHVARMLYGNTYGFWRKVQNSNIASVTYLKYL